MSRRIAPLALVVAAALVSGPRGARAQAARVLGSPADVASRGDEFASAASLGTWRSFQAEHGWPNMTARIAVEDGALVLVPTTSGWYEDFHAPFWFREVQGDFVATARVRAEGRNGGIPTTPWSLGGLMARAPRVVTPSTWRAGGENWLFVTTGVAEQAGVPVVETKTTVNSRSRLRLHGTPAGWIELRMTRRGATFELATRQDGETWVVRETFERPDLPAVLQVGLNAYTDWYGARHLHHDPLAFDTTLVTTGRPDLVLRVDWVRFARPDAPPSEAARR